MPNNIILEFIIDNDLTYYYYHHHHLRNLKFFSFDRQTYEIIIIFYSFT